MRFVMFSDSNIVFNRVHDRIVLFIMEDSRKIFHKWYSRMGKRRKCGGTGGRK